jgi:hypothetical protein
VIMFGRSSRQSSSLLPTDIVPMMEMFGRFEWDPGSGDAAEAGAITVSLWQLGQATSPDVFLAELANAVLPAGGWAAYGGERLVKEIYSGDLRDPSYDAMMGAALDFLRRSGASFARLNTYERNYWTGHSAAGDIWP